MTESEASLVVNLDTEADAWTVALKVSPQHVGELIAQLEVIKHQLVANHLQNMAKQTPGGIIKPGAELVSG